MKKHLFLLLCLVSSLMASGVNTYTIRKNNTNLYFSTKEVADGSLTTYSLSSSPEKFIIEPDNNNTGCYRITGVNGKKVGIGTIYWDFANNDQGVWEIESLEGEPTPIIRHGTTAGFGTDADGEGVGVFTNKSNVLWQVERADNTCGDNLTWTLSGGTLTISGTGKMTDYSSPGDVPWYDSRGSINRIIISDGVTSVGSYAFIAFPNLTSVTLPNSLTTIGDNAFFNCSKLTSVPLPNSVTSIGYRAFYRCENVKSFNIPISITSVGEQAFAFHEPYQNEIYRDCYVFCDNEEDLAKYISNENIVYLYHGTRTSKHLYIGGELCRSLTIPNTVTKIAGRIFWCFPEITSYVIPNSVTSIAIYSFVNDNMQPPTTITLPGSLTTVGKDCLLGNYTLNMSFTDYDDLASYLNRDESVYNSVCDRTPDIYIGGELCTDLIIPNTVSKIGAYACKNWNIKSVTIPTSVTSIGDHAFESCTGLTSITLPNSLTRLEPYAFSGCTNLSSATLSNSLTDMGDHAFESCTGLTSITLPNSLTDMGDHAFEGCTSLTSITLPNSLTRLEPYTFYGCTNLSSATLSNSLTYMSDYVFEGCNNLASITSFALVPPYIKETTFPEYDATLHVSPSSIEYYKMAEYWKNFDTIVGDALSTNDTFTSNGLTYKVLEGKNVEVVKGEEYYSGDIEIPEVATYCDNDYRVTRIGQEAFSFCTDLNSIIIPGSVTSIGSCAFAGAENITKIYSLAVTPPACSSNAFSSDTYKTANVYVPNSGNALQLYSEAEGWENFRTLIDEEYEEGYALSIPDFRIADEDGSFEASVMLENIGSVKSIEFDLVLPEGLTIENEEGEYFVDLGSRVTNSTVRNQFSGWGEENADGSIHFTAKFNRTTSTYQFTGNEGEALILPFLTTQLPIGKYQIQLKNIVLNGELKVAPSTTKVNVVDPASPSSEELQDGEAFTANVEEEYDSVTYTRTFSENNAGRWQAWYVPFDLDPTEYADDFTFARIYMMAYVNPNTHALVADPTQGELSVVLKYLEDGELVQASTPYVIKANQTGEQTFEAVDGVLHAASENHTIASSTTSEVFTFSGNYESVTCPAGWYAIAASGGFIAAEDKTLCPYRWHFEVTPTGYGSSVQPAAVANARMYVMDEDNRLLTSVMNMQAQADSYRTYDMQGRLLKGRGAQHGISIRNGRKYVR